jgi:hypothetical protein
LETDFCKEAVQARDGRVWEVVIFTCGGRIRDRKLIYAASRRRNVERDVHGDTTDQPRKTAFVVWRLLGTE